jgi:hypothetical protein
VQSSRDRVEGVVAIRGESGVTGEWR